MFMIVVHPSLASAYDDRDIQQFFREMIDKEWLFPFYTRKHPKRNDRYWIYVPFRGLIYGPYYLDRSYGKVDETGLDHELVRFSLSLTSNFRFGLPLISREDFWRFGTPFFDRSLLGIFSLTPSDGLFLEKPTPFTARAMLGILLSGMDTEVIRIVQENISSMESISPGNLKRSYRELWSHIKSEFIFPAAEDFRIPGTVSNLLDLIGIENASPNNLRFEKLDFSEDSIGLSEIIKIANEQLDALEPERIERADAAMEDDEGFANHNEQEWRHLWPHPSLI
jgi:hypothetical protein